MRVRFLEESPGVLSMVRLSMILQTIGGFVVLMTCIAVALRGGEHAAAIIAALAAGSATAFAGAWGQAKERHIPDAAAEGGDG